MSSAPTMSASSDTDSSIGHHKSDTEVVPTDLVYTPWYPEGVSHQSVRLNSELEVYTKHILLTREERSKRNMLRSMVQDVAMMLWCGATVKAYGSFACNISMPCSALDLVCENCGDINKVAQEDVVTSFVNKGFTVKGCVPSPSGVGVSYIHLECQGVNINLSFSEGGSLARQSVQMVRKWLAEFPVAANVVIALRSMLSQAKYDQPGVGGLSSYCLLCMVIHTCRATPQPHSADTLLFAFLHLFGQKFDYATHSINPNLATPVPKADASPLSVTDPFDESNNLAACCTKVPQIRAQFLYCLMALAKWDTNAGTRRGYKGRTPVSSVISHRWVTAFREAAEMDTEPAAIGQ
eukprot:TRINITY_DN1372_c0_g1_i3.p1 TRINITY_DN1372_c0_g1~~TRINITY_DN1372_c0_g1_i3.p1  ORF type:complete len:351 (+),score=84.47 TRINITY_DN1372_c0_g1_i3:45-1097(+)